jgi:hypothetical protein
MGEKTQKREQKKPKKGDKKNADNLPPHLKRLGQPPK